jgi:hypothetical protein
MKKSRAAFNGPFHLHNRDNRRRLKLSVPGDRADATRIVLPTAEASQTRRGRHLKRGSPPEPHGTLAGRASLS